MLQAIRHLDALLRGERTRGDARGRFDLPLRTFTPIAVVLGASYGFFMGWYALFTRPGDKAVAIYQLFAGMVKIPALFLCTLVVTFPSLYIFNALVGCRLTFGTSLRLLVGAIVVNLAIAASLGPILAFFTVSTTSYSFIVLLNVGLLGIAGIVSLGFLLRVLKRQAFGAAPRVPASAPAAAEPSGVDASTATRAAGPRLFAPEAAAPEPSDHAATTIFRVWIILYGLVGAQMGWLLRPFIGHPRMPFEWFRSRKGNVFQSILHHLWELSGLDGLAGMLW